MWKVSAAAWLDLEQLEGQYPLQHKPGAGQSHLALCAEYFWGQGSALVLTGSHCTWLRYHYQFLTDGLDALPEFEQKSSYEQNV